MQTTQRYTASAHYSLLCTLSCFPVVSTVLFSHLPWASRVQTMPPIVRTFSDEINYLIWRYLRETSKNTSALARHPYWSAFTYKRVCLDLTQTAWTLEAEIKSKSGKDILAVHDELGKNLSVDLPRRLRMSMQYQEVLKHMSEVRFIWRDHSSNKFRMAISLVLNPLLYCPSTNVIEPTMHVYRFQTL